MIFQKRIVPDHIKQNDTLKSWLAQGATFIGKYEMPQLSPCRVIPREAVPFPEARSESDKRQWVHFYIDDENFECLWNSPKAYLELLRSFDGVISPDFSIYRELPLAQQIWSTYRNRLLAHWLQYHGVNVIPNVRWGDERTYAFCFDGVPKSAPVAISTNGCIRDKIDRMYFKLGLKKMMDVLNPSVIINYSYTPDDIFKPYGDMGLKIIHIPNRHDVVRGRVE